MRLPSDAATTNGPFVLREVEHASSGRSSAVLRKMAARHRCKHDRRRRPLVAAGHQRPRAKRACCSRPPSPAHRRGPARARRTWAARAPSPMTTASRRAAKLALHGAKLSRSQARTEQLRRWQPKLRLRRDEIIKQGCRQCHRRDQAAGGGQPGSSLTSSATSNSPYSLRRKPPSRRRRVQ